MISNLMPTNLTAEIQKYSKNAQGSEAGGLTEKHYEYFLY